VAEESKKLEEELHTLLEKLLLAIELLIVGGLCENRDRPTCALN